MVYRIGAGLALVAIFFTPGAAFAADEPGKPAVVNGESVTERTRPNGPAERFGARGQLAISSDAALTIQNSSVSGESGSTTTITLEPAVDWFVVRDLSVGGFLEFQYESAGNGHSTLFGIGPRVGYNFGFSDLVSIWPKVGLSILSLSTSSDVTNGVATNAPSNVTVTQTASGTSLALDVFVPVMFHPAPHFFAGFGPFLDTGLTGGSRVTTWGLKLTIGGWL